MKAYADAPAHRARQLVGDVLVLAWIAFWVWVGEAVHDATMLLAKPGAEIADAGNGLADKLRDAGSVARDAPFLGDVGGAGLALTGQRLTSKVFAEQGHNQSVGCGERAPARGFAAKRRRG